ncbi:transketolase [Ilyomonas limi]|uniref:3-methyl-2-oxobutanoate dehydrogenase (2-methylpropanoyl-transferring) n=1 Tax=Ilyomonas limi TaxID=2575867 RepID=A0A4U3L0P1_9BACT|nr:thiamine pyrophosphate-dependent enzyme [Ilyomonas limi]TKK68508.1 transketolase [Ilyomonas limi]
MEKETANNAANDTMLSYEAFRETVLSDYRKCILSREASLMGRREVLTGKAKFGVFSDGKEVAQTCMAKFFQPGDFRAGYYRDQTFMLSSGLATLEQFFAELYADANPEHEPFSSGRQMVGHFSTPNTDSNGDWLPLARLKNITADMSPTAGQMPRAFGLAFTSKVFRNNHLLQHFSHLSNNGNEICFCTIGDASTSEGVFWETINAAGVEQVPLAVFVWDDGYGISVPTKYQTTKGSISAALRGLQKKEDTNGIDIYRVKGWDYASLCEVFQNGLQRVRDTHIPAIFHVEELTQPQGHSTSGSHERYKSAARLEWEREWDNIKKMREWILENGIAEEQELEAMQTEAKKRVRQARDTAWQNYLQPIKQEVTKAVELIQAVQASNDLTAKLLQQIATNLQRNREPLRKEVLYALAQAIELMPNKDAIQPLKQYYKELKEENARRYNSYLYNEGAKNALQVPEEKAIIPADAPTINGFEILNKYFDVLFKSNPKVLAFGEDVGKIGDVNQGFAGLQEKYSERRIFDTGIRENSIIGQGYGLAFRGLRPIAEIQYLDYLVYTLNTLTDDIACLHYRTAGKQSCPIIVRTRGHRLEGIWHSGSPIGMVINSLRGMYVCVPRNMTQAAGMYNTLLRGNDPGLVIEPLNGYRLKEKLPSNLLSFTVPLGVPEVIREGADVTIVTYGACVRIVQDAASRLQALGVSAEIVDVQTLLPFDIHHHILESLKKTSRILFVDEDVPGGANAYMYNQVMEQQGGYRWLDVAPRTLSAKAHRPAYGSDGDYFSKPNTEEIIAVVMEIMAE